VIGGSHRRLQSGGSATALCQGAGRCPPPWYLDAGADEYLTEPFDAGALLARFRAMLRLKFIEIHNRVLALITKWQVHDYDLGFRVGIIRGYATLGLIGFEERSQYTAVGTVTDLAAPGD
jgi:hypothetical protein